MAASISLLSGVGPLASTAFAAQTNRKNRENLLGSSGTKEEQNEAKKVVRASEEFKDLEREQKRQTQNTGKAFDFDKAIVQAENGFAKVIVPADAEERAVLAIFLVDLSERAVFYYQHYVWTAVSGAEAVEFTWFENGSPAEPYQRLIIGEDYVITEDGQQWTIQQFIDELLESSPTQQPSSAQRTSVSAQGPTDDPFGYATCNECYYAQAYQCVVTFGSFCTALGVGTAIYGFFVSGPAAGVAGLGFAIGCAVASAAGCPGNAESTCKFYGYCEEGETPPI